MCHLYPYNNVKLLRKFFYINSQYSTVVLTVVRVMIAKYRKSGIWGYCSSLTPEPIELKYCMSDYSQYMYNIQRNAVYLTCSKKAVFDKAKRGLGGLRPRPFPSSLYQI